MEDTREKQAMKIKWVYECEQCKGLVPECSCPAEPELDNEPCPF
jgi:hypothetical protein